MLKQYFIYAQIRLFCMGIMYLSLKLDKQYKKDANEAKIYIDGIEARQTTRRTLTPSYVLNVCIIHAHEHDVTYVNGIVTQMYDRQPCAGYIKRLTRVP